MELIFHGCEVVDGEMPVFARLWPVRSPRRAPRCRELTAIAGYIFYLR